MTPAMMGSGIFVTSTKILQDSCKVGHLGRSSRSLIGVSSFVSPDKVGWKSPGDLGVLVDTEVMNVNDELVWKCEF